MLGSENETTGAGALTATRAARCLTSRTQTALLTRARPTQTRGNYWRLPTMPVGRETLSPANKATLR